MNLRPYQQEAFDGVVNGFQDRSKLLLVVPTGGGKTIIFAHLAKHFQPVRTLILAHREELLLQAADKIRTATGIWPQVERAEDKASLMAPVVVASVQTLLRRKERWPADHFGLVVVDEAHHILAKSYLDVLSHFEGHAKVLGVTATPDRGDKKNLGKYFEDVAYEISLGRLIKEGFLSRIHVKTVPVKMDLRKVKKTAGDYSADDLGEAIEPWLERISQEMLAECWGRKTIVFLPLVKTAQRMAELCNKTGMEARSVSGYDDNRAETLKWFSEAGPGSVLCNSMLLTEGFDQPDVDCIVNLRPTQMRALFAQIVGRGTRLSPGKENCLLLDFLWQTEAMSLVSPARLISNHDGDTAEVQKMLIEVPEVGGPGEEVDLLEACDDVEQQRFRKVREKLEKNKTRKPGTFDAMDLCMSIGAVELMDFEPMNPRQAGEPTQRQKDTLERAGFDINSISCFGHANAILDRLAVRRMEGLATPKQVRMLERFRHPKPEAATFTEASQFIDEVMRGFKERKSAA